MKDRLEPTERGECISMTSEETMVLEEFRSRSLESMNYDQTRRYLGALASIAARLVKSRPNGISTVSSLATELSVHTVRSTRDSVSAVMFGMRSGVLLEDDFLVRSAE